MLAAGTGGDRDLVVVVAVRAAPRQLPDGMVVDVLVVGLVPKGLQLALPGRPSDHVETADLPSASKQDSASIRPPETPIIFQLLVANGPQLSIVTSIKINSDDAKGVR